MTNVPQQLVGKPVCGVQKIPQQLGAEVGVE
jgi:hypothetical protein